MRRIRVAGDLIRKLGVHDDTAAAMHSALGARLGGRRARGRLLD